MKIRRAIIATMLLGYGILGAATPAHAGLWCENADKIDESTTGLPAAAGTACRVAVGVVCHVVDKTGGACLD